MQERIKKVMSSVFGLPEREIPDSAAFDHLKGWDSLGHITLMMAIEQEFSVELNSEAMLNALTLPALEDFVRDARPK